MATADSIHQEIMAAFNARDFDTLKGLLHPEYQYIGGDGQVVEGPDQGVEVAKMYASAFPDIRSEARSTAVAGDTAVCEFHVEGTHTGDMMGITPTGRRVNLMVCNVIEVRDGLAYREREYFDAMAMWSQLGLAQSPVGD